MCIFLLPLFYMVSKLAEEKESKAREGMKMMGLNTKGLLVASTKETLVSALLINETNILSELGLNQDFALPHPLLSIFQYYSLIL